MCGRVQVVRVAGVEGVPRLRGVFERTDAEETSSGDHDDLQDVTDHTVGNSSAGSIPSRPMGRQTVNVTSRWADLCFIVQFYSFFSEKKNLLIVMSYLSQ